ncbi:MAG: tripartite tricarboxylate transporter substrate binding protein [Lautropia sp.]
MAFVRTRLPLRWPLAVLSLLALLFTVTLARADDYPSRSVRIVVPFPPGGGTDVIARTMATELGKALGQTFIVDNRSGANGLIGTTEVARAPTDGYTLLFTISSHVTNTLLYAKPGYQLKDFRPISIVATSPFVLAANPAFPPNTFPEFLALAKRMGSKLDFASPGIGSTHHISVDLLKVMTGIDVTLIPYKGGGPAMADVLAGQVPVAFMTPVQSLPNIKAKKLKAIAVSSAKRSSVLPDVPTIAESGLPGYESDTWFGFMAPVGVPRPVIDKLNAEIVRIVKSPQIQSLLSAQGAEPVGGGSEAFEKLTQAEYVKWGAVFKKTGTSLD